MTSPLSLREEAKRGDVLNSHGAQSEIYVQGLSEFCVKSVKETLLLLSTAERNRKIRETTMNLFSSRSHSIFQVQQRQDMCAGGLFSNPNNVHSILV